MVFQDNFPGFQVFKASLDRGIGANFTLVITLLVFKTKIVFNKNGRLNTLSPIFNPISMIIK